MKLKGLFTTVSLVIVLSFVMSACGQNANTIVIGVQTYSEPKIIGEMYKALIENRTDLNVKIKTDLAASAIVIQAMKKNEVQMATLYSGEIFNNHFDVELTKDRAKVLKQAQDGFHKHFDFKWFESYGFENTYALAVRQEVGDEFKLKSFSDLKDHAKNMSIGVDTTWLERENDGYKAFTEHYGFSFGKTFPMEISLVYAALADKNVDVILAYTTDPGLQEFNLRILEDDKQYFPPYDASPVVRNETLTQHPELNEIITLLEGKIDATTMTGLNYKVDVNKRSPKDVAHEYLKKIDLLK